MSTDFSIRPVGAPAPAPVVRPSSEAVHRAVPAELPPAQSVTAADTSAAARNDPGPARDTVSHQAFIDRAAGSIVYRVVDELTNLVVRQFPDEAVLRRRAYFRALDLAKSAPARLPAADLKA